MNKRLILLIMILLLVPMIMAACGEDEGDDDDNGDNGDDNGSVELSQSFSEDGLSFDYPDGWVASNEEFGIVVANSEDTLTAVQSTIGTDEAIPEGAAAIVFLLLPTGGATLEELETSLAQGEEPLEFERITVAGQDAGRASSEEGDNRLDQYVLVYGDNALAVTAAARTGEFGDFEDTFEAILESHSVEVAATDDGGETGDAADDGGETGDEAEDGGETGDEAEDGGDTTG